MRFSAAVTADRLLPARIAQAARPLLDRVDAVLFAPDARGEAGRISVISFAVRVLSAAIAFGSQVLMARWMGDFEYGVFVLVWIVVVIGGSLTCLGFHTSVVRLVPEYREKRMFPELRGILYASRLLTLVFSTGFAAAAALFLWALSDRIEPYYVTPFLLGLFAFPMVALGDTLQGLARAHAWAFSSLIPTYVVRPVLMLVLMFAAVEMGYAPDAVTAVFTAILATYATTVTQLAYQSARMDAQVEPGPSTLHLRSWIVLSLPIFLIESFFFLLTNADVLMVGFYLKPEDVAVYFATVKTLALVHFVYFAVKAGSAQRFAQISHADPASLPAFARDTVSWTFWPSLGMAAVVLLLGELMLDLFGPEFAAGYPLLVPLLAGVVLRAAIGPAESLLTMSGHQNTCAAIFAATLAVNIALSALMIPHWGLWGAAFATTLSILFETASLAWTVWRRMGFVMFIAAPRAASA